MWLLDAVFHLEHLRAEPAQLDVKALWPGSRMPLEACSLEVLNRVDLPGIRILLLELFGDWHTIDGQPAELVPVGREASTEVVTGGGEVGAATGRVRGRRLEGRLIAAAGGNRVTQQPQLDIEALWPGARMLLEPLALEVL